MVKFFVFNISKLILLIFVVSCSQNRPIYLPHIEVEELPFEYYSIQKEVIKDTFKLHGLQTEIMFILPHGVGPYFTNYASIFLSVNNRDCEILTKISFTVDNLISVDESLTRLNIGDYYYFELVRQPPDLFKQSNLLFNHGFYQRNRNGELIKYMERGIFKVPVYLCTNVITLCSKSDNKMHFFIKKEEK